MKKTYQNPTMKIVKVETKRLMNSGSPAPAPGMVGKNATSEGMSRRGRSWDEEEDDFDE